jgi:hypothetical protein
MWLSVLISMIYFYDANAPFPEGAPAYRQAGVSFRVGRLRELVETKNVTE